MVLVITMKDDKEVRLHNVKSYKHSTIGKSILVITRDGKMKNWNVAYAKIIRLYEEGSI